MSDEDRNGPPRRFLIWYRENRLAAWRVVGEADTLPDAEAMYFAAAKVMRHGGMRLTDEGDDGQILDQTFARLGVRFG